MKPVSIIFEDLANNPDAFPCVTLLEGPRGVGKFALAKKLVTKLMSQDNSPDSAEHVEAMSHPDLFVLQRFDEKSSITSQHIQELNNFVFKSPVIGTYKYVIVNCLDEVHHTARDAILKSLESNHAIRFFLLAHSARAVTATIRSRSHSIFVPPLEYEAFKEKVLQNSWGEEDEIRDLFILSSGALGLVARWCEQSAERESLWNALLYLHDIVYTKDVEKKLSSWINGRGSIVYEDLHTVLSNLVSKVAQEPKVEVLNRQWILFLALWSDLDNLLQEARTYHTSWKAFLLSFYCIVQKSR